jgi:hypothetical protein
MTSGAGLYTSLSYEIKFIMYIIILDQHVLTAYYHNVRYISSIVIITKASLFLYSKNNDT